MLRHECRERLLAKLTSARCELEDALTLSTPVARYDPTVLSGTARNQLSSMIDELNALLRGLEGVQQRDY